MPEVRSIILGLNEQVFRRSGFADIESWQAVPARARRRRYLFDGKETLACYIASRSDIEDVIPALTAYQIEWNKMNLLLQGWPAGLALETALESPEAYARLSETLQLPLEDLDRLRTIWRDEFIPTLKQIRKRRKSMGIRLLSGSLSQYMRATHGWWENIQRCCPAAAERPLYFVSSNPHSLVNLLTGFPLRYESELVDFVSRSGDQDLQDEWRYIQTEQVPSSRENFLYYVMKKYQQTEAGRALLREQAAFEAEHGISRVPNEHSFDLETQIIDLSRLAVEDLDPRLRHGRLDFLARSDAVILNIDYPLGLAAFNILSKVAEQSAGILGVYIMGKSASLNAVRGDVLIPNVVQDEHSRNTYLFENCFTAGDVAPYLTYGTVLDNQKAVCVLGTFLQNAQIMDVFFREGYADIEMEAGPFLSAVYEMFRPKRHPIDEIVNLYGLPFDLGILHYVSDTPLSKGKNLGAGTLSYFGMDSTYAASLAIARRIIQVERGRIHSQDDSD